MSLRAAGLLILVMILFAGLGWREHRQASDRVVRGVAAERDFVATLSDTSGLIAALALIDARSGALDTPERLLYILIDPETGDRLAGNLGAWPRGFAPPVRIGASPVTVVDGLAGSTLKLDDHFHLFIGRPTQGMGDSVLSFAPALALAIGGLFAILWLTERQSARRFSRRVAAITDAMDRFGGGALESRVADTTGDALGQLAQSVDGMLSLIAARLGHHERIAQQIVHELRAPVAYAVQAIRGSGGSQGIVQAERVEPVLVQLMETMDAVILLTEMEERPLRQESVPLRALIADLVELYADAAAERGIRIDLHCTAQPVVTAERALLMRLFANLIDNAIKYSPMNAMVALSVGADARGARVSVTDAGPGRAALPDAIGTLGMRGSHTAGTRGTGLGLAMAFRIARIHGASITLADRSDHSGLIATVRFPGPAPSVPV
ncbi:HAMP domain-containing sensor histidine kinase [Sphingomonas sp. CJ99]